jgi:hypothetical protein
MRDPNMDTEDQATPAPPSPAAAATDLPASAGSATVEADGPATGGDAVAAAVGKPAAGEVRHEAAAEGSGEGRTAEVPSAPTPADTMGVPGDVPSPAAESAASDVRLDEAVVASSGPGADEEPSVGTAADEEPADAAVVDAAGDADEPGLTDTVSAAAQRDAGGVAEAPPAEPGVTEPDMAGTDEAETGVAEAGVAGLADEPVAEDEDAEPVGGQLAVAEPVATATPQPRGVWTDEQAEAFRARLREVTSTVVDRAAGAVIETVNSIAAAVRSRTSSDRRRDPRG